MAEPQDNMSRRDKFRAELSKDSESKMVADALDIPVERIGTDGLRPRDRLSFSFASSQDDMERRFYDNYPNGAIAPVSVKAPIPGEAFSQAPSDIKRDAYEARVKETGEVNGGAGNINKYVFRYDTTDKSELIKFVDPPGFDIGDPADMAAGAIVVGATIAATATGGPGVGAQTARTFAGSMIGETIKRSVNQWLGAETTPSEEVGGAVTNSAIMSMFTLGTLGAAKMYNTVSGGGWLNVTKGQALKGRQADEAVAAFAKDEGIRLEPLMTQQRAPTNPVLSTTGKQAVSASQIGQEKLQLQGDSAVRAVAAARNKVAADAGFRGPSRVFNSVINNARKAYNSTRASIENRFARAELTAGDKSLRQSFDDIVTKTREQIGKQYATVDDVAAKDPDLLFDFKPAMPTVERIEKGVRALLPDPPPVGAKAVELGGSGVPTQAAAGTINVQQAGSPLLSIINDIKAISKTQPDYKVVKALRTRLWALQEALPWDQHIQQSQAQELYKVLSGVMMNPARGGAAGYTTAIAKASGSAAARFSTLKNAQLRTVIQTADDTGELVKQFGNINKLSPRIMGQLDQHAGKRIQPFKDATLQKFLTEGDGVAARIRHIEKTDNATWKWLTNGNKRLQQQLRTAADDMDSLNVSAMSRALDAQKRASNIVRDLTGSSNKEIGAVVKQFGGKGSKGGDTLRYGVWDDLIESSVKADEAGRSVVNVVELSNRIEAYEKSGIWTRVLTGGDRTKMRGLKSYLSLLQQSRGSDAGTSLIVASAISKLKDPKTFIAGARELTANKAIAYILASKTSSYIITGTGKGRITGGKFLPVGFVAKALAEGQGVLDPLAGESRPEAVDKLNK